MRSVILSVLLCTFCIHRGYSRGLIQLADPDVYYKNHQACLAEQKLDIMSVFGVSDWNQYGLDDYEFFKLRKTLDENKRNILLTCMLYHKPIFGWSPIIIKTKDGRYEIDLERANVTPKFKKTCKVHERDLNKFVECYYDTVYDPMLDPSKLNN